MLQTFVLVHGSWQGGWSWQEVAARLRARGHRAVAPTLPGHDQSDGDRARISHDDYVAAVLSVLEQQAGPDPVVLVAHSFGGAVISQVADRRPDRVHRLIYCDAFVLRDGEAVADVLPAPFVKTVRQLATTTSDRSVPLPWELWRDGFMQTADEQTARATWERLVPEPSRPIFEPLRLSRLPTLEIPTAYITFRQDQAMPPGFWHPGMSARLGAVTFIELEGDHEALLTHPDPLAAALTEPASENGLSVDDASGAGPDQVNHK
jgi:pimeloyl-ACP methyl ester carboxylesterase